MRRALIGIGLAWLGIAFGQAPAPAGPAPLTAPPLEHYTRHDEFGTVKISPDGEFIAFTAGKYGRSALVFKSLKDSKVGSGVRAPERFEIFDFHWVSPTRLIYFIAERQPGQVRPTPTGEILAIDRDGSRHEQIYGYRAGQKTVGTHLQTRKSSYSTPQLIDTLPQDPRHILIAEYPWREVSYGWVYNPDAYPQITRLDLYSGQKTPLGPAPLRQAGLLTDRNHQVRFAVGLNDEFKLAISWKPEPQADWTAFELPGFREESVTPRRFGSDNRSVLFTGVRDGESATALYRLDLASRAVEQVFAFEHGEVYGLLTDLADREVIGVRGYTDRPSYHWLSQEDSTAKLYAALLRAFPNQSVAITSTTEDGRRAIVFVSSDVSPGDYYLFDTTTKKADFLRAARSWIDPANMRPKQSITVTARDGMKLHGYLTQPAGAGPHPLIVLPHGGPHGIRDTWDYDWEVQLFASRGYSVLQVNYRGSGGYGMDFEAAGYREWGARMQDDITDATRWMIEQKLASADRICIVGTSYGGYAALMGAVREPQLYQCAIGYAGVYDLELAFESGDLPDSGLGRAYLERVLGTDVESLRARSPAANAQRIEVPVLLVHGKEDQRADYKQARRMKAALEAHNKQLEWLVLSREGHGVYDEETRREVYERMLAFLDRHLARPREPAAAADQTAAR